jgi:hypothetical protein
MANTSKAVGFIPIGHITGGFIPEPHEYVLYSGAKVFKGDPVYATSSGTVNVIAAGETVTHIGVAAEYKYDSGSSGTMKIKVYDDPNTLFMVQTYSGDTTTLAWTFYTADIITYTAGNAYTGQSKLTLGAAGTSTLPWIIVGLYDTPDNTWGQYSKVIVKYNYHILAAPSDGI